VVEQLGTGQQLVALVVVADEIPPVHSELLAQVQLDVVDRHPPADPGHRRVAAARPHVEQPVRHPPLAVPEPAPQLVVFDPPEADLALGERTEFGDRSAVEMRLRLNGDRLDAGDEMGDELVRRPPGARRHGVRRHRGERVEEGVDLTPPRCHVELPSISTTSLPTVRRSPRAASASAV
jgi:hypothetical protein